MVSGRMKLNHLLAVLLFAGGSVMAIDQSSHIYIGTYTGGKSKGIYYSAFDAKNGKLGAPELAAETKNPTFLCLHPNGKFLYAVGEIDNFGGKKTGAVEAYRIEEGSGKLTLLNQQPSEGTGPCHLAIDKAGRCMLVANYGSGSIAALPVLVDGTLGPAPAKFQHEGSSVNKSRQAGPHAHFITPDPTQKFALTCDLGLDKVLVYKLDTEKCSLTPNDPPSVSVKAGEGPRHLVFHPSLKWMYVINEMGSSISAFEYDSKKGPGKEFLMISTLPKDFKEHNSGAEIQMHPSGKFLYGSNRGQHSIALFSINQKNGRLTFMSHQSTEGKTPRHFAIDPSGKWVIAENQDSDSVVVLGLDQKTGKLRSTGEKIEVGRPVCVLFTK
jgi:6-phosphogluconolactonase